MYILNEKVKNQHDSVNNLECTSLDNNLYTKNKSTNNSDLYTFFFQYKSKHEFTLKFHY